MITEALTLRCNIDKKDELRVEWDTTPLPLEFQVNNSAAVVLSLDDTIRLWDELNKAIDANTTQGE